MSTARRGGTAARGTCWVSRSRVRNRQSRLESDSTPQELIASKTDGITNYTVTGQQQKMITVLRASQSEEA